MDSLSHYRADIASLGDLYLNFLNVDIRELKRQRWWRIQKRHLKSIFTLLQTLSCLFHLVQFGKWWQIFLELNSKGVYRSSEKEKENCCLVFTSIMHASHVCSQHLFGLPLRAQFDHARFDILPLFIWSHMFWPSVTRNLCSKNEQKRSKNVWP